MISSMEKINGYFEELVPASGKADSLAGELVRAVCRIGYRFYNDGDQLGIGYGKETCNPAGRFLMNKGSERIGDTVAIMWGKWNEEEYERRLDELVEAVIEHIDQHPSCGQRRRRTCGTAGIRRRTWTTGKKTKKRTSGEELKDLYF